MHGGAHSVLCWTGNWGCPATPSTKWPTSTGCVRAGILYLCGYTTCTDAFLFIYVEFLTVLSLSRNQIKKIEGLEPVADTLEELWLSYNLIERVNGIECCKKLKVFYLSNNKVKGWDGLDKLVCPIACLLACSACTRRTH